ncbi:MAG: hypothetical protein SFU91_01475 [Chloroherpetonaceae bacterium]|nr:hypothetical protein [Chloroherpetonaceae bacterium]
MITTRVRWIWIAFILLIGLNLILMAVLFLNHLKENSSSEDSPKRFNRREWRGRGLNPERVEIILREKVNFSEEQLQAFRKERESHFKKIKELRDLIHENRSLLYQLISNEEPIEPDKIDSVITVISGYEAKIDKANVEHFQAISSLCKPEQKREFRFFLKEMSRALMPPRPPGGFGGPP